MAFRFRKLKIYTEAVDFHKHTVKITRSFPKEFDYLINQIRRASLSVILNIAEGSAKNSDKDFRRYLGNSLGSLNEVVAGFDVAVTEQLISGEDFLFIESPAEKLINKIGSLFQKLS